MWIMCEGGEAINGDYVTRFRRTGSTLYADLAGTNLSAIVTTKEKDISWIVRQIVSGNKYMDFRGE